jgi:hypothetical protein
MGLENGNGSVVYVNTSKGKLTTKTMEGEVKTFDSLTGRLTGIEFKDDEYNGIKFEKLILTLDDGTSRYLLQMRMDSGYARGFLFAIKNADLSQDLTLIPNAKEVNGKSQTTVFLKQGGTTLKWVWTKDHPGDLPQLSKVMLKGNTVYDNTEQTAYLKNMLLTEIVPNLGKGVEVAKGKTLVTESLSGDDDLPF